MRRVASRKEMQRIDAVSIEEIGIPGLVLMEIRLPGKGRKEREALQETEKEAT